MLEVFDMFDWFEPKKVSGVFSHVKKCSSRKKILKLFIIETTFCYTMYKKSHNLSCWKCLTCLTGLNLKKCQGFFSYSKNVHQGKKFLQLFIIETTFCYTMYKNHTTFHVGSV